MEEGGEGRGSGMKGEEDGPTCWIAYIGHDLTVVECGWCACPGA